MQFSLGSLCLVFSFTCVALITMGMPCTESVLLAKFYLISLVLMNISIAIKKQRLEREGFFATIATILLLSGWRVPKTFSDHVYYDLLGNEKPMGISLIDPFRDNIQNVLSYHFTLGIAGMLSFVIVFLFELKYQRVTRSQNKR
jgi:hypothetical protein